MGFRFYRMVIDLVIFIHYIFKLKFCLSSLQNLSKIHNIRDRVSLNQNFTDIKIFFKFRFISNRLCTLIIVYIFLINVRISASKELLLNLFVC